MAEAFNSRMQWPMVLDAVERNPALLTEGQEWVLARGRKTERRLGLLLAAAASGERSTPPVGDATVPAPQDRSRPRGAGGPGLVGSPRQLYAWQAEALAKWRDAGCRGVVEAVTGTGKTALGIEAVREHCGHGGRAVVLVPTIELQQQWVQALRKVLPDPSIGTVGGGPRKDVRDGVTVAVVHSAHRHLSPGAGSWLVVADECHRYAADSFRLALHRGYDARLGLTATYERDDGLTRKVLTPFFGRKLYKIGYDRALGDDVVARYKVALVPAELSPGERAAYEECSLRVTDAARKLSARLGITLDDYERFARAVDRAAKEPSDPLCSLARSYRKAINERRDLLGRSAQKLHVLALMGSLMEHVGRCLVFGQGIGQSELSAKTLRGVGVRAEAFHSNLNAAERCELMSQFRRGDLSALTAARVLDEGIDVPEADLGVIISATRAKRQMIQRMGRVLRRKEDGRLAAFAVVYARDTIEDPARGVHKEFLDEVLRYAEDVQVIEPKGPAAALEEWLRDRTPAVPPRAPRFEGEPRRRLAKARSWPGLPISSGSPELEDSVVRRSRGRGDDSVAVAAAVQPPRPVVVSSGFSRRPSRGQRGGE